MKNIFTVLTLLFIGASIALTSCAQATGGGGGTDASISQPTPTPTPTTTPTPTPTTSGSASLVVFDDAYAANVNFAPFGGSTNTVTVSTAEHHSGTSSLKVVIPGSGNYTGGSLVISTPTDLHTYNAITFWAKSDVAYTFEKVGMGNDANGGATYGAEVINQIALTTSWQKFTFPLPDASKLTSEVGLFHFAQGGGAAASAVYFDDIAYESVGTLTNYRASFGDATLSKTVGDSAAVSGQSLIVAVSGTDVTVIPAGSYFTYQSNDTNVATVSAAGAISCAGTGTATITAKYKGNSIGNSVSLTVTAAGSDPTTLAPTPTWTPSVVASVYNSSSTYTNVSSLTYHTTDWWSGDTAVVADASVQSATVKKFSSLGFVGVEFANVDATTKKFFHMDVYVPTGTKINVKNVQNGGGESKTTVSVTAGQWNSVDIDLSAVSGITGRDKMFQIVVDNNGGDGNDVGKVFIDNILFHE